MSSRPAPDAPVMGRAAQEYQPAVSRPADFARFDPKVFVAAAVLLILAAAGLGYWRANPADEAPPEALAAKASNDAPKFSEASKASETSEPADPEALAQANAASAPSWPIWAFRLKEPIPPREEPLTPLPWRLMGASGTAGAWQLIVLRQGKTEPEYFRVGDSLPGGYRINAISEEDVTLKHGRREIVLSYIASR